MCGEEQLDREVKMGFASDLMSDVLTLLADDILLITGFIEQPSYQDSRDVGHSADSVRP
jgi:hypothetical protein